MRTRTPSSLRRKPFAAVLCACAAASLALASTSAAMAASTIASLPRATEVHAYGGVQVYNAYDDKSERWRVQVRQAGRVSTPAIGASRKPRDIDVGPDSTG